MKFYLLMMIIINVFGKGESLVDKFINKLERNCE